MSEPILMPFQDKPFNGDTFMEEAFLSLKKDYGIEVAVETGSCLYVTTKWLGEHFDEVHTIEINADYAAAGIHRVKEMQNVHTYIGDSPNILSSIMPKFQNKRTLFFLDAHWQDKCPLLSELDIITQMNVPPVIVIHDFYTPNPEFGYDSYNGQPFTYEWIKHLVDKLIYNTDMPYIHTYNVEATGAKRGVIYLKPLLIEKEI